ncbi:MAG: amino acid ABC transporter permease [Promethearchaeota archaeon]
MSDVSTLSEIIIRILERGLYHTLFLTALGLLIGFILGMSLALMRVYGAQELIWFSSGYEKLFRGIPLIVLIYVFFYALPDIFWYIDPLELRLASVVLALALRSAAYQSQIFRGAILSVSPGQMEAARALGMKGFQAFRHVIMPQALRLAVPGWSNEYAVVIKDTSFASAIGIIEMTQAAYFASLDYKELWALTYLILAIIYLLLTYPVTRLFGERQSKKLKKLGMGGD